MSTVVIQVKGTPARAQLVLYTPAGQVAHRARTGSDGRGSIGLVAPGRYGMRVQRAGTAASDPREVVIGPGRVQLVIGR